MRALIAAFVALFGILSCCSGTSDNAITGEKQRVRIIPDEEVVLLAGSLIDMKHSRDDELESDTLSLRLMREAVYDPRAMLSVMQKLEKASGGSRQPEFASTHPSPANRIARIREQLEKPQ